MKEEAELMGANMHDVAKLARVSQRTVSNVVSGRTPVREETRERVQKAIDTLRYRPNVSAQKLRMGRTGMIALAIPEIKAPYFAELADNVQQAAARRGVTLLIEQTGGMRQRELLVLDGYRSNIIDGLILSPLAITPHDLTDRDLDFPIVLLGESVDNAGIIHVSIDNVAAARLATQHLLEMGRTRVAVIGATNSSDTSGPAIRRFRGYLEAFSAAGMSVPAELIFYTNSWTRRSGETIAAEIVQSKVPIDAIFCFNDLLALGAITGLRRRGVNVPGDIAVVGWDDIEECEYSLPALTTVAPDKLGIAGTAVDKLLDCINGQVVSETEVLADYRLVKRGSTVADAPFVG